MQALQSRDLYAGIGDDKEAWAKSESESIMKFDSDTTQKHGSIKAYLRRSRMLRKAIYVLRQIRIQKALTLLHATRSRAQVSRAQHMKERCGCGAAMGRHFVHSWRV